MNLPILLVFDIDGTLLSPNYFTNSEQVAEALFHPGLLTPFLMNSKFQLAIASFNSAGETGLLGGRRLGRAILDLYHFRRKSKECVEDEFIQAWMPQIRELGKNLHIMQILRAYLSKYGENPPLTVLFDNDQFNIEMAKQFGIVSIWTPNGLSSQHFEKLWGR